MTRPKERSAPSLDSILWTDAEAAAALYTTRTAVERARTAGQLRAVRIGSGPWRYRPADVRAYVDWLASSTGDQTADRLVDINRPRKKTGTA